mmetsp:Transcript_47482/g.112895  ORF Transcript_47482/g.112895 Transcript_47482/m.112895 type:complete len:131 (+) Transcript_47482:1992-2384(+)
MSSFRRCYTTIQIRWPLMMVLCSLRSGTVMLRAHLSWLANLEFHRMRHLPAKALARPTFELSPVDDDSGDGNDQWIRFCRRAAAASDLQKSFFNPCSREAQMLTFALDTGLSRSRGAEPPTLHSKDNLRY